MIDFHTHILPNIDDGSQSLEESLAILSELEKQGVNTVILTPHYYGRKKSVKQFLEKRDRKYNQLTEAYTGNIKLIKGCECNLSTCANGDFTDFIPLAIEGTKYILIEMAFTSKWEKSLSDRLFKLMNTTNLTPVIAHVELYPAVKANPELAHRLIEMGCLLQMNCLSILNCNKKDLSWALLTHNQIHCLGSDTHNLENRPPLYASASGKLKELFSEARVDVLQNNMNKIILNQKVDTADSEPIKKRWFSYV